MKSLTHSFGWLAPVLLLAACAPPDVPRASAPALPEEALRFLSPDSSRAVRVADGVVYRFVWSSVGPWAVHLLEVDASRCGVGFSVVRAPGEPGTDRATETVRELSAGVPGAVAAVNGDFFNEDGVPSGIEVSAVGVRGSAGAAAFVWNARAGPWIGDVGATGGVLTGEGRRMFHRSEVPPEVALVSGFPRLLDDGIEAGDLEVASRPEFAGSRHPRTAVAVSATAERVWILVVEGRRAARSAGMTLPELAELLRSLGAEDAVNLDGGGSSSMVLGSRPVSLPSEGGVERPVANALVVMSAGVVPQPVEASRSTPGAFSGTGGLSTFQKLLNTTSCGATSAYE